MSWLSAAETAKRFAVTRRHLDRLVAKGILPRPTLLGSRLFWSTSEVEAAELRRQFQTKPRKVSGARKAIEGKRDGAELARSFMAAWDAVGLEAAIALVRAEGVSRPKDLKRGQHARLSFALRRAADAGMTVDRMLGTARPPSP